MSTTFRNILKQTENDIRSFYLLRFAWRKREVRGRTGAHSQLFEQKQFRNDIHVQGEKYQLKATKSNTPRAHTQ